MANDPTESGTAPLTEAEREEQASQVVDRFSLWSGAAGLIPIPIVDVAAVAGVQLQMLRRLSEIYGVPFIDNRGKSVIASAGRRHHSASTATTTAMTFGSLIKGIPGIGTDGRRVDHAGVFGRRDLRHRQGVHEALRIRRHAARFRSAGLREFIKAQQEKVANRFGRGKSGSAT